MAWNVKFRRKREGRTNYKKRLSYLLSKKPRAVIRKSASSIIVQILSYNARGDVADVHVNSKSLSKMGWEYSAKNTPASYLAGLKAGVMAAKKGIKDVVVDFGLQVVKPRSKLYAAVKGLEDAGIKTSASSEVLPADERICGKHIEDYKDAAKPQFSKYENMNICSAFNQIKEKVLKND